jgi:hypothetical protein
MNMKKSLSIRRKITNILKSLLFQSLGELREFSEHTEKASSFM